MASGPLTLVGCSDKVTKKGSVDVEGMLGDSLVPQGHGELLPSGGHPEACCCPGSWEAGPEHGAKMETLLGHKG